MGSTYAADKVWIDKSRFDNAERIYYEFLTKELSNGFVDCSKLNGVTKEVDLPNGRDSATVPLQPKKSNKTKKSKKMKSAKKSAELLLEDMSFANSKEENTSNYCRGPADTTQINTNVKKFEKKTKMFSTKKQITAAMPIPNSKYDHVNAISDLPQLQGTASNSQCTLVSEIAKAREHIKNSLEKMDGIATLAASPASDDILDRITAVEKDNQALKQLVDNLKTLCLESQKRITLLENQLSGKLNKTSLSLEVADMKTDAEVDDGVDLFASDSEEESADAAQIREQRLAAYAAKKSKKPALIAKSSLVLDVKPWDDETDLKAMEAEIRKIGSEGLLWGASKFLPVAFGIQKLAISCVVEDEKVSIDWLTEEIEKLEDFVQSVDVAAFNKI